MRLAEKALYGAGALPVSLPCERDPFAEHEVHSGRGTGKEFKEVWLGKAS